MPQPFENFDSTMVPAKDYILRDEALNSSEDEERIPPLKQHKNAKGEESSNK